MSRRVSRISAVTVASLLLGGAGLLGSPAAQAAGAVSLTGFGTAYTQDFNTLAATGTSSAVPTGWDFLEAGTNFNSTYTAGTGSLNTGDTYSFGATGSTERAFGGLLSGSLTPTIGAQLTNNTGGQITSLDIAYTGEQWRLGATARGADRLDFQLSTNATSLNTGTWVDQNVLDFNSPVTGGTVGALNGNDTANRTSVSATITGLSIPDGASFWIRWNDFNVSNADDGLSVDDFSLTAHGTEPAPTVVSTVPSSGATGVALTSDVTVTFSEPVDVTGDWFSLDCDKSGTNTATVTGGPTSFTLDPAADFVDGDTCTLTVHAAGVSDQDVNDPPDTMAADYVTSFVAGDVCAAAYTPAYQIQGSGDTAAITGTVTTQGVVVGDYEGPSPALRGFFLQDATGDGNAATSDGLFVFEGSNADTVNLGDIVRVTGTAGENQGQTQVSVGPIRNCGTGTITPTDVTLPFASATSAEQYEGMLVRMPQTLYVTEHFQLGRFGQVVMSAGGRLQQPTNVVAPGSAANAMQAANNLNRIIVDDASQAQNPDPILFARGGQPLSASNTLRGGDTATGIVGVMTYTWAGNAASPNAYRVRPVNALGGGVPDFQPANPRPAAAPTRTGDVRVASMNLLNFFNTFDGLPDPAGNDNCTNGAGGAATDCRGADTQAEFDRQWPKTVAAMVGSQADVIGINEIENDGYGPDSAIAFLVDKLNEATAPGTYAFIDVDANTGQVNAAGTDAIKVGMIYKPSA
ncbi:MAG TPA: ExeM/NucH family extracellular endonuclease, partial [Actinomycetes bacterium]